MPSKFGKFLRFLLSGVVLDSEFFHSLVSYSAFDPGASSRGRCEYIRVSFRSASLLIKPLLGAPAPKAKVVSCHGAFQHDWWLRVIYYETVDPMVIVTD